MSGTPEKDDQAQHFLRDGGRRLHSNSQKPMYFLFFFFFPMYFHAGLFLAKASCLKRPNIVTSATHVLGSDAAALEGPDV